MMALELAQKEVAQLRLLLCELSKACSKEACIWKVLVDGQAAKSARLSSAEVCDLKRVSVAVKIKPECVVARSVHNLLSTLHPITVAGTNVHVPAICHIRWLGRHSKHNWTISLHLPAKLTRSHRCTTQTEIHPQSIVAFLLFSFILILILKWHSLRSKKTKARLAKN